ncbi:F-box only protein 42-like [Oppia nitens]|uniref:F-box only protein 42-like n=1 Tax=Oppia nitens TaxID=1686743 RepID=UPI0023DB35A0|nr:F-box only protein 42-like [Oppia nitens]
MDYIDNQLTVTTVDDIPQVVLEYILSYLSPYRQLIDCKLVSKTWRSAVIDTIRKLKRDFIASLVTQSIRWWHLSPSSGPSISGRYSHSACLVGSSMYVFGGCTIANTTFNDLWRFDLSSRTWIRPIATGTFPSPKACASMAYHNNYLILFGGWTHSSPYPIHQEWRIFNQIHLFDTTTYRWSLVVPTDSHYCPAIAGHSASIIGHYMIVFGGLHSEANNPIPFFSSNDVWILNLETFVWNKQPVTASPKPLPRYGHSQVVLDDQHILITGGSGGPNMLFNDIWLLCIPDDWSQQWYWRPIEVIRKDSNPPGPQINFHPTCKIANLLVVLSPAQRLRPTNQCKDQNNKLRNNNNKSSSAESGSSSSSRQYSAAKESAAAAANDRLDWQQLSGQVPTASTSTASTSISALDTGTISTAAAAAAAASAAASGSGLQQQSRPLSRRNRQRQLEGLDRMELRIQQMKKTISSPLVVRNTTIRSSEQLAQNPMQLFCLDISQVIGKNIAKWVHKNIFVTDGPEEVMLYTLVAGRAELIMFGGIQKDRNCRQNQAPPPDSSGGGGGGIGGNVGGGGLNDIPDIVSNQLHIITAKRIVI